MTPTANFIQIHFLTAYGANVLNRDDLNRPKSMVYGSTSRLRLSSQSLKRAWRTSPVMKLFELGTRSRDFWLQLGQFAVDAGHSEADVLAHILPLRVAVEGAKAAGAEGVPEDAESADSAAAAEEPAVEVKAGKPSKKKVAAKGLATLAGNLFFFSESETTALRAALMKSLGEVGGTEKKKPLTAKEADAVLGAHLPMSADVAMFGRMVAEVRKHDVEGAVQVAHAFTVNKSVIDDDFFTAVDDLSGESGSGHMGSNAFGSGLYYGFVNIDVKTLLKNFNGDIETARQVVRSLVETCATVAPGAKQNSFAARSYATYICVETGDAQPRSYADAFLRAVSGEDISAQAIERIVGARAELARSYPSQVFEVTELNRAAGTGSLPELQAAAAKALG